VYLESRIVFTLGNTFRLVKDRSQKAEQSVNTGLLDNNSHAAARFPGRYFYTVQCAFSFKLRMSLIMAISHETYIIYTL
jgi:hypothetical protein